MLSHRNNDTELMLLFQKALTKNFASVPIKFCFYASHYVKIVK